MKTLTNDMVIKTKTGTPQAMNMYAYDVVGAGAVAAAAHDCVAGESVRLAVCKREPSDAKPKIVTTVEWALSSDGISVRYCTAGNPEGAGSHRLCGSWPEGKGYRDLDVAEVAAHMMSALDSMGGSWIFRLK